MPETYSEFKLQLSLFSFIVNGKPIAPGGGKVNRTTQLLAQQAFPTQSCFPTSDGFTL